MPPRASSQATTKKKPTDPPYLVVVTIALNERAHAMKCTQAAMKIKKNIKKRTIVLSISFTIIYIYLHLALVCMTPRRRRLAIFFFFVRSTQRGSMDARTTIKIIYARARIQREHDPECISIQKLCTFVVDFFFCHAGLNYGRFTSESDANGEKFHEQNIF